MIRVFRLPLRASIGITIVSGAVLALLGLLVADGIPIWSAAVGALVIGGCGYLLVHLLIVEKLREIERLLLGIGERSFDAMDEADVRGDDELAELGRLARRSGKAVREEMEELKKMESYRRDFIGNVSHELKTPIFAIKGFSETLLRGAIEDPEVNRSFINKIFRNADRLDNLAKDLSEISAMETGQLRMVKAPFAVDQIIWEVLESLEPLAAEKEISMRAVLPQALPPALGDQERIRQVLTNLVDNALKYTNPSGSVEVVARSVEPSEIKISVVDDGIGIAVEHLPRLTERFYRVDKSRSRSQGGTGLGLSIVKHILAAHGRKLQVSSTEGRGSTFGFSLQSSPVHAYKPDRYEAAIAL